MQWTTFAHLFRIRSLCMPLLPQSHVCRSTRHGRAQGIIQSRTLFKGCLCGHLTLTSVLACNTMPHYSFRSCGGLDAPRCIASFALLRSAVSQPGLPSQLRPAIHIELVPTDSKPSGAARQVRAMSLCAKLAEYVQMAIYGALKHSGNKAGIPNQGMHGNVYSYTAPAATR